MDSLSIVFLLFMSSVFAVYPDVKKQINFSNFLKIISYFFMAPSQYLTEDSAEKDKKEHGASSNNKYIPYEKKYIEKFRNLIEEEVNIDSLENTMVVDHTPYGNVAMKYNKDKDVFIYYTDHSIPYRFLESVAQKFAIQFNAKKLVVDTEQEIENIKKENNLSETNKMNEIENDPNPDKNTKEPEPELEKKSVFAKFKSYNQITTPGVGANVREVPSTTKSKESEIILEKTNTYSCEGKFSHLNILQKVKPESLDTRRKMTFADFKNLLDN